MCVCAHVRMYMYEFFCFHRFIFKIKYELKFIINFMRKMRIYDAMVIFMYVVIKKFFYLTLQLKVHPDNLIKYL